MHLIIASQVYVLETQLWSDLYKTPQTFTVYLNLWCLHNRV